MEAARAVGVERIVYTSSVATLKPVHGVAVDETSRHSEETVIGAYKRSKLVAERLVERMVAERGLPAVIVNPSTPIGPRDIKPTPTGRIIVEAATGRMPAFVDTGLNLVHVDDVAAQAICWRSTRGRIGENYILGGQDVRLKDMLAVIAPLVGRKPPRVQPAARPALSAGLWRRAGRARHRQGTVPHRRCAAHGQAPHVLLLGQGGARAGLQRAALMRGAIADAIAWFRAGRLCIR